MSVGCLICLAISLVAGGLSLGIHEEIAAVLSVSIAAICSILCLILAPWPVQLLVVCILPIVSKLLLADDPSHA